MYRLLSSWFLKTECLWLNVPLPESCPTSLTGYPSSNKDPNASASAVDQSMPFPSDTDALLAFKILIIVLCKFNSSGIELIFSEISKSFLWSKPLMPLLSFPFSGLYLDQVPSYHSIFGL